MLRYNQLLNVRREVKLPFIMGFDMFKSYMTTLNVLASPQKAIQWKTCAIWAGDRNGALSSSWKGRAL